MIVECNLLCVDIELVDMGIDSEFWIPMIFLMKDVEFIKLASNNEDKKCEYNKTSIHLKGEWYITDIPFKEFSKTFKQYVSNNNTLQKS